MTQRFTLFGSAGTGKTRFGIEHVVENLQAGVAPEEIAYLAFTRAAARVAIRRIREKVPDASYDAFTGFRTLHSWCLREMQKASNEKLSVFNRGDWKAFSQQTGMEVTDQDTRLDDMGDAMMGLVARGSAEWDDYRRAYSLSRLTAVTIDDLDAARLKPSEAATARLGYVADDMYLSFATAYEKFKRKEGLLDFTDMLEWAARTAPAPERIKRAIIDEGQDLSPLLYQVLNRIFDGRVDSILMIGDDLQAIFSFAGVNPEQFLTEAVKGRRAVQTLTWRFGQGGVKFSREIAERIVVKQDREIQSAVPDREHFIRQTGSFQPDPHPGLILHRHVAGCQAIGKKFIEAGIPFRSERGKDPLGAEQRIEAYKVFRDLSVGKKVQLHDLTLVFSHLMKSMYTDNDGVKHRLVVHGAKKKTMGKAGEATLKSLLTDDILTQAGHDVVREKKLHVLQYTGDLQYYERLLENGYDFDSKGPSITTIHGSKGREAERVTVFTEMSANCWSDTDTEHRLAYVASTRTKRELTICGAKMMEWGKAQYYYPKEMTHV